MDRRGFTLLEVLVATVIMSIAIVGLLAAMSSSMRNASRLTEYDRAVYLARAKMDELLIDYRLPENGVIEGAVDPALLGGRRGGWHAQLSRFETPAQAGPGAAVLERIALELWWMEGDRRRVFPLEAYRRNVIPKPERNE